ncbi:MAG: S41 family peptidase [Gemmatimonadota bacterium]
MGTPTGMLPRRRCAVHSLLRRRRDEGRTRRRSRIASLAAALATLLLGLSVPQGVPAQETRAERWRADLAYFTTQLELRHPDLYHTIPRERFHGAVRAIRDRIPALSEHGIAVELARLLARVGDGHTLVPLMWDRSLGFGRLPVELVRTSGGVSVLAADSSFGELVGARVLRIGSLDVDAVLDSVATIVSRDNAWTPYTDAAEYAGVPEILHTLGITTTFDRVPLVVEDRSGDRRQLELAAVDREAPIRWDYGEYGGSRPWLSRRDDAYWLTVLPDDTTAYVQFNRADRDKEEESVAEFGRRLLGLVREGSVRRIVLDLRWNRGGSRWRARHLLGALVAVEHALGVSRSRRARTPGGHLVTLIGPNTFSAATQFALDLELHTNTAFVGLPTGGKPNHFGEVGRFRLPESGFEIRHSVYYHQATHARDTRPAIFPDRWVHWTPGDVAAGRDPVLEAALAWRALPSAVEELRTRVREDGTGPALAWLDSVAAETSPDLAIEEGELNRFGYELLSDGDAAAAAAVFRWNADRHPWSANVYDSLADAYLALGRDREAGELLCRAFAIDPQFDRALDRGLDCGPIARRTTGRTRPAG